MPCVVQQNKAVYETRMTPRHPLAMSDRKSVFFRAERQRDSHPYKRYVTSTCQKQADRSSWRAVKALLTFARNDTKQKTQDALLAQSSYDASQLRILNTILQHLRNFKGHNNSHIFQHLANRIDALDEQARVSITPFLHKSHLAKAKNIRSGLSNHPRLAQAKKEIEALILSLENHTLGRRRRPASCMPMCRARTDAPACIRQHVGQSASAPQARDDVYVCARSDPQDQDDPNHYSTYYYNRRAVSYTCTRIYS